MEIVVNNLTRLKKMQKIAFKANKWPANLSFNMWTEQEAERFLKFNNLEVPEKKSYSKNVKELSWLDRFLMKINCKNLGKEKTITVASWPGPNMYDFCYNCKKLNYFLNHTNDLGKNTRWHLVLCIYPEYNSNVVDVGYVIAEYLMSKLNYSYDLDDAFDLDGAFDIYPINEKQRIIRNKDESVNGWNLRIAKTLQEERLKMQKAHEKRMAWLEEEYKRAKKWGSWINDKIKNEGYM
jgi:hypothetical protein